MKKIKLIIMTILMFMAYTIKVNALNYADNSKYDFESFEKINLELNGYNPKILKLKETSSGELILLVSYKEENSQFSSNNYTIPGSDGGGINGAPGGTSVKDHSKIVKLDKNYNKIWERNFYIKGNWRDADAKADTVTTHSDDVTELSDGGFVVVGYTHGLIRNNYVVKDDDFDSIITRFDESGNIVYQHSYYNGGLDYAIAVRSLENGGYVVKFYYIGGNKKPSEFEVNSSGYGYYYAVYDKNNNLVDSFSDDEISKINSLSFIGKYDKQDLEQTKKFIFDTPKYKQSPNKYIGVSIADEIVTLNTEEKNDGLCRVEFYDFYTMELKRSATIEKKIAGCTDTDIILTDDGGFISKTDTDITIYNKNGEITFTKNNKELTDNTDMIVMSNGDIVVSTSEVSTLQIFKPNNNEEFANYIIDGKKIKNNLSTFLENDRTYINLNNLCSVMGCTFKRSEKNNNMLIIKFDAINDSNKMLEAGNVGQRLRKRLKYTITHEIGSKKYTTYLEFQPKRIFILKSPTFNANEVDVESKEKDGKVYVPLRFISEALGRYVSYNPNGENNKPTITISSFGEGEFYEKYNIGLSFDKYHTDDILSSQINTNVIDVLGSSKKLYAYGYEVSTNKIKNTDKTIFMPTFEEYVISGADIEYNEKDDSSISNNYTYLSFKSEGNWITGMFKNQTGHKSPFLVISNIEGYPFIKLVDLY